MFSLTLWTLYGFFSIHQLLKGLITIDANIFKDGHNKLPKRLYGANIQISNSKLPGTSNLISVIYAKIVSFKEDEFQTALELSHLNTIT
jgi:hypothetical protein